MKQPCKDCQERQRREQKRKAPRVVPAVLSVKRQIDWKRELELVLRKWHRTPYVPDGRTPRVAACCYGFVVGVLDELHGLTGTPPETVSNQLAMHDATAATRYALKLVERYPSEELRLVGYVPEPGDVLFVRVGHGVGHAGIVGVNPLQLWHADLGVGVTYSGVGVWLGRTLRAYRSKERHLWFSRSR